LAEIQDESGFDWWLDFSPIDSVLRPSALAAGNLFSTLFARNSSFFYRLRLLRLIKYNKSCTFAAKYQNIHKYERKYHIYNG